jgi:hypothetical protein
MTQKQSTIKAFFGGCKVTKLNQQGEDVTCIHQKQNSKPNRECNVERKDKRPLMDEDADKTDSKKQKTTITEIKEDETPYKLFFIKLKKFAKEQKDVLAPMMIKGVSKPREDDEDYDEDEDEEETEEDKANYTQEQVETMRFILITKKRRDKLNEMNEFVLQDEEVFNTAFSYRIRKSFPAMKRMRNKMKNWSDKFDLLFAYTYTVSQYNNWVQDNEGDMNGVVDGLGRLWKHMLKKSDKELGIDLEYTRPGILELLESFKKVIDSADAEPDYEFNYI